MAGAAFERAELVRLLVACKLPEAAIADFERCNVGTIMLFSSFAVGKLVLEPPDGGSLATMLIALRTGSTLAGAEKWPDPTVAAEAASYTVTVTKMTMLCRFVALQKEKAALRELTYVGAAGADSNAQRTREEDEKRNHKAKATELSLSAAALYNTDFSEQCDSATLVTTHHAFGRHRLAVARLRSGKYGHASVHIMEKAHWVAADDHTIKEESAELGSTALTRNGQVLIQIFNVTESLVIAGASEINKTVAHSAGSHGTVNRGTTCQAGPFRHGHQVAGGQGLHAAVGQPEPEGARGVVRRAVHSDTGQHDDHGSQLRQCRGEHPGKRRLDAGLGSGEAGCNGRRGKHRNVHGDSEGEDDPGDQGGRRQERDWGGRVRSGHEAYSDAQPLREADLGNVCRERKRSEEGGVAFRGAAPADELPGPV